MDHFSTILASVKDSMNTVPAKKVEEVESGEVAVVENEEADEAPKEKAKKKTAKKKKE